MRYFIEIAYNGKNYYGWQRQPHHISVQEVLEEKLSLLLRRNITVVGAGRTDTGVHAKQLFAHFDGEESLDPARIIGRLNSFLPKDIAIATIVPVKEDAHARFDAVEREYQYVVSVGKNPFAQDFSYQIHKKPDVAAMNQAAEMLLPHSDFQCFSRSRTDVKTYNCEISHARWEEEENNLIFTIVANRFLRNMVRAVVGTLLDVGWGKTSLEGFADILKGGNREDAGPSAPPQGLFLTRITYPPEIFFF